MSELDRKLALAIVNAIGTSDGIGDAEMKRLIAAVKQAFEDEYELIPKHGVIPVKRASSGEK